MSKFRLNLFWVILLMITAVFMFLYLYYSVFTGGINSEALNYFSREHIYKAGNYAKIMRLNYIFAFIVEIIFLSWFLLSGRAKYLSELIMNKIGSNYYLSVVIFFIIFLILIKLISLPFNFFGSYIVQHQWGFSNQSLLSWCSDFFKGSALEFIFSSAAVLVFMIILNNFPRTWWFIATVFLAFWLILQSYLAPLVIDPMFNKFETVTNPKIIQMVENLSQKADLNINKILKMDASTRTKKVNAYFAGLGKSKRIVIYDNLLNDYTINEIEAVIAHEMGHWKLGHIRKGMTVGIVGLLFIMGLMYIVLQFSYYKSGFMLKYSPIILIIIFYYFTMMSFVTSPIQSAISRSMEREADDFAVRLTNNKHASIDLQKKISKSNFSDISPPEFIEWFNYSHPSTIKRIKLIENINLKTPAGN